MKKSLIALAVAGVVSAPAFAATSNVDVYGVMNIAIQDTDANNSDMQVTDNFSRIGFKGSEDLGGGLKALWQIESGLGSGSDGVGQVADLATRNTFVGLAGGFGTALIGRHDTPYKIATGKYDLFGDTVADYNLGRLNGVQAIHNTHDHRSPNAIAYISPSFSGVTIAAAVVATNAAANLDSGDTMDAISLAAMYANGPLTVDVAYQDVDADLTALAGTQDSKGWKIGAGYTFGDAKVGMVYESVDVGTTTEDRNTIMLIGSYAMGPITLKATYADISNANWGITADADQTLWALGADYALSKRTTAYVVYGQGDSDKAVGAIALGTATGSGVMTSSIAGDVSGWNIGVKHSF